MSEQPIPSFMLHACPRCLSKGRPCWLAWLEQVRYYTCLVCHHNYSV